MNHFYYTSYSSPSGKCIIASLDDKICWFSFNDTGSHFKSFLENYINSFYSEKMKKNFSRFKEKYPNFARMIISKKTSIIEDKMHFYEIISLLDQYFAGDLVDFNHLEVIYLTGTDFQQKVWNALREIPRGETRSYKELAAMVGRPGASRAVGTANSRNIIPLIIPCHRVIKNDGSIGGYSGGLGVKENLLQLESVTRK
jgi:O-6-methylguanine DNA methyltransferase